MNWRPRTCFSCTYKKKSWMGVPPPCSVFIDARESIKNISSCYASACFLLSLSLSVSFCCCLHRKWHPYYIIRYISQRNRHEMVWNDVSIVWLQNCSGNWFCLQKALSSLHLFASLQLVADASCHSIVFSGDWMSHDSGKHVPPPPWYGKWGGRDDG